MTGLGAALAAELLTLGAIACLAAVRRPHLAPIALALGWYALLVPASTWVAEHSPRLAVAIFAGGWSAPAAALLPPRCRLLLLLPFALYALALAFYGGHIGAAYPWALRLPRLALGALAASVAWRGARPRPPAATVGLTIAAFQVGGVLAGAWAPWTAMQAVSLCGWAVVGAIVIRHGWGRNVVGS